MDTLVTFLMPCYKQVVRPVALCIAGVTGGAVAGHSVATALAVGGGAVLTRFVSPRVLQVGQRWKQHMLLIKAW
jgi:hypothetical protein